MSPTPSVFPSCPCRYLSVFHPSPSSFLNSTRHNDTSTNIFSSHFYSSINSTPPAPNPDATMDAVLCDELLEEIFHRLPPFPTAALSLSLVSKRWLRVSRSSTTSLTLRYFNTTPTATDDDDSSSFISYLSAHPFLSSLTFVSSHTSSSHLHLYLLALLSSSPPALTHLRLLSSPLSTSSLLTLSTACANLLSLSITLSPTFDFTSFASFPLLNDLSLRFIGESQPSDGAAAAAAAADNCVVYLPLETLSLTGIRTGARNMRSLWRSCKRLKTLKLNCCEGLGVDEGSLSCLDLCFSGLEHVELMTCRTIANVVLTKLADLSLNLNSLLVHDGGCRHGLLHFITTCKSKVQKLDFQLPLDLDDDHLFALAQSSTALVSLRLRSCFVETGQGLKSLAVAAAAWNGLQELALVSCDVVEREPGLLTDLGQNLKMLKKLNLSYNETLQDKVLVSMLGSCGFLSDLRLRGCRSLTNASLVSISRSCKQLKGVDIAHCCKLEAEFVEMFVLSSTSLRLIVVEEEKVTDIAKSWMWRKSIDHVFA